MSARGSSKSLIARILSRYLSAWQPDILDGALGTVVLAGAEVDDAWQSDALFRSGDRGRPDVGAGVRPAASTDRGLSNLGAEADGAGLAVPDQTDFSRQAAKPRAAIQRPRDRIPENEPVHVLIDSTGLQVSGAGQRL